MSFYNIVEDALAEALSEAGFFVHGIKVRVEHDEQNVEGEAVEILLNVYLGGVVLESLHLMIGNPLSEKVINEISQMLISLTNLASGYGKMPHFEKKVLDINSLKDLYKYHKDMN